MRQALRWVADHWELLLIGFGALMGAGLIASYCFRGEPLPPFTPVVIKPDSVVVKERPSTGKPSLGQRLTTHPVAPARIVSAGVPDTARVRAFARKVFEAESLRAELRRLRAEGKDTSAVSQPDAILPPTAGKYDGQRLDLWLSRSDGSVMQATARLRPRFEWTTGAGGLSDSVPQFREDRAWLRALREIEHCALPTGVLAAGGAALNSKDRVLGAAIGAGAGLLGCMAD